MSYVEIKKCRICGNDRLATVVDLGEQCMTGVFPGREDQAVTSGPLELVKCVDEGPGSACGLLQLRHSYDADEMYGMNYGYRSGLNKSMVEHLGGIVEDIMRLASPEPGDLIIDIGSNDGTLLRAYPDKGFELVGIDPSGAKFQEFYPSTAQLIPEFFSAAAVRRHFGAKKAKVISSIAMFYDLERPLDFVENVRDALAEDGIWVFEQSYMPTMMEMNAYDTICHEHLEYYGLRQVKWMLDKAGMKVIGLGFNDSNGGSFRVTAAKSASAYPEAAEAVERTMREEESKGLRSLKPYEDFQRRIFAHREELAAFFRDAKARGKTILGYGASTKGNVVLQFCGIGRKDMPYIAEVNPDKFGHFTPGSLIPIVSEAEARKMKPDYLFVLPWHFRKGIVAKEAAYLESGGLLFFPLPAPGGRGLGMTKALIVGCDGQDGRLLRGSLSQKGCEVLGIDRRDSTATKADWRLDVDIGDPAQVREAIAASLPDQVYYLAAVHGSSESLQAGDQAELLSRSLAVNVESLSYFLESIRTKSPESRFFYAASSHVFGDGAATSPQDEDTPFHPTSIYGMTKAAGVETCRYFRERFGIFASCGILYNHESVYRGTGFLTRKILDAVRAIKEGRATRLVLGSLDAEADWGYAPDFVEAFQKILQASAPDDFVVATGIKHTVREFVGLAFDALGLDWTKYVDVDTTVIRHTRNALIGNPRRLREMTGWIPSVTFAQMVGLLVEGKGL